MPPKRKTRATANDIDLDYGPTGDLTGQAADPTPVTSQRRKRQKKGDGDTTAADVEPQEKRQAIFKKRCPKSIEERVDRVKGQRFYMIEREREEGALKETFKVLGSTGNVYTVTISHIPKCNCPDGTKGNHCKHIIFVFLKVLSVPESSSYFYQKALLTSELAEVFAAAPPAPTITANHKVVSALAKASGKAESSEQGAEPAVSRREVDGQDCPICYEEMKGNTEADLAGITFCDTCQNGLHTDCFQMWARKRPVTCVYCRAPVILDAVGPGGTVMSGGYLNLAAEAGMSRVRDKSTYYHGVQRGRKFWERHRYDDD